MSKETEFYLQDNRSYVGNDILWWADKGGYTTDLSKAQVWTKEKATSQNRCRETDIPWPKKYVDEKTRPAVDMQNVSIKDALKGTDIELYQPPKPPRKPTEKCYHCGKFITEEEYYTTCNKCEGENRP